MTDNKCPDCSATLPPKARFCNECGAAVGAARPAKKTEAKKVKSSGGKKGSRDMIIIAAVIVIVAGGYMMFKEPEQLPQKPGLSGDAHTDLEGMDGMIGSLPNMPADYNGLVDMGNQLMDQSNFAVAAECYKRALVIKGDSPNVRTDFGACLHGMGLPHRAIEEFMTVIKDYPKHGIANYNLGIVYLGINNPDSARTYWEKYLKLEPNGSAAESARNYLNELGGGSK